MGLGSQQHGDGHPKAWTVASLSAALCGPCGGHVQLTVLHVVLAQGQVWQLDFSSSSLPAFSLLLPRVRRHKKLIASKFLASYQAAMAAHGRGLGRALSASPCPAWRRAHWEAKGQLKPEYDAVVIGAGKPV